MSHTPPPLHPVVIVGGGWAGLSAAVELSRAKVPVLLLESARQLGGRARGVRFGELAVDNGQHLLIGAYHETLRLLSLVGRAEEEVLLRLPLQLRVHGPRRTLQLTTAPSLPAPLHLGWGLLTARGLTPLDRWRALAMSARLWLTKFQLEKDISVHELLLRHKQSPLLIAQLWEPLCLAALNTPASHASAEVFLRVLRDSFAQARHDADMLIPRRDLGVIFPQAAFDFIEQHGGLVHLNQRVTALAIDGHGVQGVAVGEQQVAASAVIIATSPTTAGRLLSQHDALAVQAAQLDRLTHEPIVTVYLHYPPECRLEAPMVGMSATLTQWLCDRHLCDQPGLIAAVISADGPHMESDNDTLGSRVAAEVAARYPHWPAPLRTLVIREKRATFHCGVDINQRRPANATPVKGLWLAGDYTPTSYPATLEGAVRSGVQCAQSIIAARA